MLRALCLVTAFVLCECKTKCFAVKGQLKCSANPALARNLAVTLLDRDGRGMFRHIDNHDKMGVTITDDEGRFSVNGCGRDFGPWNTPDPMLDVTNGCRGHSKEKLIKLPKIFHPHEINAGIIELG